MSKYQIMEGSPGLAASDLSHLIIPGRGRDSTGQGLSLASTERAVHAAEFYIANDLEAKDGKVVCCGYKTPADNNGEPWWTPDSPSEVFTGIPEAESMRSVLLEKGLPADAIETERCSINTITNFTYAEAGGFFGINDERPVGIVSHEEHLDRIIKYIAPKTLRRDFLGVVVPEGEVPDREASLVSLASQLILLGINPKTPNIAARTYRRSQFMWKIVNGPALSLGFGSKGPYKVKE